MSPDLIDAAVANGAKGLVIAGVGDGNMTTPALDAIKRAIAKGVVVVRSSRGRRRRHPPQHRSRRRQGRHRCLEGAQSFEGPRPAEAGADADVDAEAGPGTVRQVLTAKRRWSSDLARWFVETLRAYPELAVFFALAVGFVRRVVEGGRIRPRERNCDPAGRCPDRPAGDHGRRTDQVHLLPDVPLRRRVRRRPAVLPRPRQGRAAPDRLLACRPRALPARAGALRGLRRPRRRLRRRALRRLANHFRRHRRRDRPDRQARAAARPRRRPMPTPIPIGYAVTYIFGTIGSAIVLAQLGPKLIGVDLARGLRRVRAKARRRLGRTRRRVLSAYRAIELRAYRFDHVSTR